MVLEARNIHKAFTVGWRRKKVAQALKGVNLSVDYGETVGVAGASGAGKTTLALILTGLLKPDAGAIFLKGRRVWNQSRTETRRDHRRIQIVWQHPETAFNPCWKIRRSVLEPYRLQDIRVTEDELGGLLDQVGLGTEVLTRFPSQLSGGELQRLALARALALQPDIIILDEPTSMLDAITQAQIIRLLEDIQRRTRIGYVFISHDRRLAGLFCHRACALRDGVLKPL